MCECCKITEPRCTIYSNPLLLQSKGQEKKIITPACNVKQSTPIPVPRPLPLPTMQRDGYDSSPDLSVHAITVIEGNGSPKIPTQVLQSAGPQIVRPIAIANRSLFSIATQPKLVQPSQSTPTLESHHNMSNGSMIIGALHSIKLTNPA